MAASIPTAPPPGVQCANLAVRGRLAGQVHAEQLAPGPSGVRAAGVELRRAGSFLGPWLVSRLRGRSSGDGRRAKRPTLLPVTPLTGGTRTPLSGPEKQ